MDTLRGRRRATTAAQLAHELRVSLRTVYRDVQTLIELDAPIDGAAGIGYLLRPGFFLPPLMFNVEELEALTLGARWVKGQGDTMLTQAVDTALAKIGAASPKDLRQEIAEIDLGTAVRQTHETHNRPSRHSRGDPARTQAPYPLHEPSRDRNGPRDLACGACILRGRATRRRVV
ncbi:helix-turn-helix transcriptional regulator [Acidiferrobacter thiooxydans]